MNNKELLTFGLTQSSSNSDTFKVSSRKQERYTTSRKSEKYGLEINSLRTVYYSIVEKCLIPRIMEAYELIKRDMLTQARSAEDILENVK